MSRSSVGRWWSELVLVLGVVAGFLVATPPDMAEAAASRCSGQVCIEVDGSGLNVDRWRSIGMYSSGYRCRTASFFVNDSLYRSRQVCGTGHLSTSFSNLTFANGTQLCNQWQGLSGRPCITIRR